MRSLKPVSLLWEAGAVTEHQLSVQWPMDTGTVMPAPQPAMLNKLVLGSGLD